MHLQAPDSSGFVDYSSLRTDGPDGIPVMAKIVPKVAAYFECAGMEINVPKKVL